MRLSDQICGANGDSRVNGDHQIRENLQRMEAKRKDWEAENTRLSRRVLFIVLGLVAAAMVAY